MKTKITDLREHLFAQLERLGDESLDEDGIKREVERGKAIQGVAGAIIDSARVEVDYLRNTGQSKGTDFLPHDGIKRIQGDS
ncbi:hypothetical protein ACFQH5_20520 [Halomonas salifodinae]|uniref:Phage protein n=1 Tax=Halomonas salifodinae TaxID=438745 RepID=A0ABW2F1L7_9GAMM